MSGCPQSFGRLPLTNGAVMVCMSGSPRCTKLARLTPARANTISGWVGSRAEATTFGGRRIPWPLQAEDVFAMTDEPGREVHVLLDEHEVAVATGSVLCTGDGSARIGRVLDAPDRRGHGYGRAIMGALIDLVEARPGINVIRLGVHEDNSVARGLYKSLGFQTVVRDSGSGDQWTGVQMERPVAR